MFLKKFQNSNKNNVFNLYLQREKKYMCSKEITSYKNKKIKRIRLDTNFNFSDIYTWMIFARKELFLFNIIQKISFYYIIKLWIFF